jgi:hypothetical protein
MATKRLQEQVQRRALADVRRIAAHFTRYAGQVVRNNPGKPPEAVLHRADVLQALDTELHDAHTKLADLATASYQASMRFARSKLEREYAGLGYEPPAVELWPSGYLSGVLADLDRAMDDAKTDILNLASAAYRGVTPPPSYQQRPGGTTNVTRELGRLRALAVAAAVNTAMQRLDLRVRGVMSVLVTKAQSEIQQDSYEEFGREHPTLRLGKRWMTTSADPCDMCLALEGTIIGLDTQFSYTATLGRKPIPVFRDLQGPPRHPQCQCELELVILPSTGVEPVQLAA